ncbi:MAG TPA: hypothetical protein VF773_10890 [Verrucomicrobiae bacterium]
MAVFRSGSELVQTAASATPSEPSGAAQNDILLCLFAVGFGATGITFPAGWNTIDSVSNATFTAYLGWIRRGAGAATLGITWTGGSLYHEYFISAYKGCPTGSSPIESFASSTGTSATPDPAAVTPASNNAMVVSAMVQWAGATTGGYVPPANYILRSRRTVGDDCGMAERFIRASGSSENPGTWSNALGSNTYWCCTVVLIDDGNHATPQLTAYGTPANGTTSITPSYPTSIQGGSKLFLIITGRSNTANTVPAVTGGGWTSKEALEGGTGTWAADTGTRRVDILEKDTVTGSESGTITVTLAGTTANTLRAQIVAITPQAGATLDAVVATDGADTTNGTGYSAAGSAIAIAANDLIIAAIAQNLDTGVPSSHSLTATSLTFSTAGRTPDGGIISQAITAGNDHRAIVYDFNCLSGSATSAPTLAYTSSGSCSGPTAFLRFRSTVSGGGTTTIGNTRDLSFDIRASVNSSRAVSFNVLAGIGNSRALTFDLRAAVGNNRAASFDIRAAVGNQRTISYNLSALAGNSRQALFDVRALAGNSRTLTYDLYGAIGGSRALSYAIRAAVGNERQLIFDIASALTTVGNSRALSFNIFAGIGSSRALTFNVLAAIGNQRSVSYNLFATAGNSRLVQFNVLVLAGNTRTLTYSLREAVGGSRALSYAVRAIVGSERGFTFDIESTAIPYIAGLLVQPLGAKFRDQTFGAKFRTQNFDAAFQPQTFGARFQTTEFGADFRKQEFGAEFGV